MNNPGNQLGLASKKLRHSWEQTQTVWNDSVSRNFERDYVQPFDSQLQAVQREMKQLAQVIAGARRTVR